VAAGREDVVQGTGVGVVGLWLVGSRFEGVYSIAVAPLLTSHWTHLPHHQQQSRRLLQEAAADSGTGVGQGDGQRR